jgi:hypothetical protein
MFTSPTIHGKYTEGSRPYEDIQKRFQKFNRSQKCKF